ncbi:fungal specific transcription factor domain-containing protein [Aspergillus affinis]|uniref:fungal specific transcription factor domain-containing protein n=1 Tax=Aspergillus affinis TaxID=1070780 RepID=UPI0022FE0690|nr:uncharacterized protein KD926_007742 [Aspergillus affinis]KAI9040798.1 hypothetical protein KD926_007742 [Aspergillus affinis]
MQEAKRRLCPGFRHLNEVLFKFVTHGIRYDKLSPNAESHHTATEKQPVPNHSVVPRGGAYQESVPYSGLQSEPKDVESQGPVEDEQVMEGQSSLSAHSSFAINLLHNAIGANSSDIERLLETLRHILDVSNDQRASSSMPLLPLAKDTSIRCDVSNMPPLEKKLFVLQQAKDGNQPSVSIYETLLPSHSLSDLFLKVYFSNNYSDAEIIIANAALYALIYEAVLVQKNPPFSKDTLDDYKRYYSLCQVHIETALAKLPLCTRASHELALALFLGATYAVDISKPSLSWNMVGVASQHARSLGFHTRPVGTKSGSNTLNSKWFLFWAIYMLEGFLCLRPGRSFAFQDNDITLPLSKASSASESAMEYFGHTVRLAGLAGRIYEQLYCATALSLPTNTRQTRVTELSQELHGLIDASHAARDSWIRNAIDDNDRQTAIHTSMSGDVLRLSMLTLIHRAMPHDTQQTTISDYCIATARYALEKHEAMVKHLELKGSILLTSYIIWSILLVPFFPFIALFCHVIETGDPEDLTRMQTFVASLESACSGSRAIAKHHRLFQVFKSVALRYTELWSSSSVSQGESARLRMAMDTRLHALGLQVRADLVPGVSEVNTTGGWPGAGRVDGLGHSNAPGMDPMEEHSLQLGNWFSFGQNMMELVDENEWLL